MQPHDDATRAPSLEQLRVDGKRKAVNKAKPRGFCPVHLETLFDVHDNALDPQESLRYLAPRLWVCQVTDTERSALGSIMVEMRLPQVRQGHPFSGCALAGTRHPDGF